MLSQNKSVIMLRDAEAGGYGVPAIVCYNMEQILATVRAAEKKRSPAMILLFPHAMRSYGSLLVNMAAEACKAASVPVAVHLDHEQSEESVKYAASLPFDSIMVDMSHHELEENLAKTKELTEYCHARGIAVEAESGRIEGGEDGLAGTEGLDAILTTPEDAMRFVDTGIDFLAPAIGNIHGGNPEGPFHFDYPRLESIRDAVKDKVQLVLHGTTSDKEVTESIKHGIAKVNMNRQLEIWNDFMRKRNTFLPVTGLMDEGIQIMQTEVERLCDVCGSSGKV